MSRSSRGALVRLVWLLWVLLGPMAQAATGPEVAQLLNNRYRATPQECPGNHAAYYCSGVLVSGLAGNFTVKFWEHGPTAIELGARSFSYLRRDVGTRTLTQPSGMVFSDAFTAISQGKPLEVLCAYPLVSANRDKYGCGIGGSENDPGSCAAQGVSDAPGWLAFFQQQGQEPSLQCSLSSRIAGQFRASLLAHEQLGGSWVAQPNQLQVRNWDSQAPAQVPVQALFYDVHGAKGLRVAQSDQRDYYAATGEWLPILRLDMTQPDGLVFGFDLQEQLYVGYQVAGRLNARYANTATTCPEGSAAFNCNGVLIRTTDAHPDFHAWNPSPGSVERNGVAFSYMRADIPFPILAWDKHQGLIVKELAAPMSYRLIVRCSYPYDGSTFSRSDSCNEHSVNPAVSRPCAEQGISTVEQWLVYFRSLANPITGCSFRGDATYFALSIQARIQLPENFKRGHNEVIIASWDQDIPERIPLEAFFYTVSSQALPQARYFQWNYFEQTGKFLPIVKLNPTPTDEAPSFSFDPRDQVEPGAPGI
ncbi:hypothetical protein [Pseudomonas sp. Z6-14]|uniref:hypothetical protein n=1 Tax=Pseudomonas sp. Z6-14 TaxID=2817416 RepID=UPI003DA9C219